LIEIHPAALFFEHLKLIEIHPAARLIEQNIQVKAPGGPVNWSIPTDDRFFYRLQSSPDGQSWSDSAIPEFQGTGSSVELELTPGAGTLFYRIVLLPGF
jgi:hypothetical protein